MAPGDGMYKHRSSPIRSPLPRGCRGATCTKGPPYPYTIWSTTATGSVHMPCRPFIETESPSLWQTWMQPGSRATLIYRDTDCIHSEGTDEDYGAFRFLGTGESRSGLKLETCTSSISSIITDEEEETMPMKDPPHLGRSVRENCLDPIVA